MSTHKLGMFKRPLCLLDRMVLLWGETDVCHFPEWWESHRAPYSRKDRSTMGKKIKIKNPPKPLNFFLKAFRVPSHFPLLECNTLPALWLHLPAHLSPEYKWLDVFFKGSQVHKSCRLHVLSVLCGNITWCRWPDCCLLFPQLRDVLPDDIDLHSVSVFEVSGYDMSPCLWHWN